MSSALVMERGNGPALGPNPTGLGWPGATSAAGPTAANWCVLPRCTAKFEKCTGGFKLYCNCEDDVACGTLQNLCKMLCDGMCGCCCTLNGITICQCNLACGICKCEYTKNGVCISCTSGDKACCEMLQKCCDCLETCCKSGCCCYLTFNGSPVCCATC